MRLPHKWLIQARKLQDRGLELSTDNDFTVRHQWPSSLDHLFIVLV